MKVRILLPSWMTKISEFNMVNWIVQPLVRGLNDVRSNVWAVVLILVGIELVMHGHENVGGSLVTGAFAVFRSSNSDPPTGTRPPDPTPDPTKV
jgi:hypothetical protein